MRTELFCYIRPSAGLRRILSKCEDEGLVDYVLSTSLWSFAEPPGGCGPAFEGYLVEAYHRWFLSDSVLPEWLERFLSRAEPRDVWSAEILGDWRGSLREWEPATESARLWVELAGLRKPEDDSSPSQE